MPLDRLEAMAMLLSAVERGSLSAAARAQNTPVSTLTRKITDLEAQLGTRLLIRTTRKIRLTDAGTAYVAAARGILEQVRDQERAATGEFTAPRGDLVVATSIQFGRLHVLPVITAFLAQFPEIRVRLLQSDRNVDLVDAEADLAVRIGRLPDSNMVATRVGSLRVVLCASPALLARHGVPRVPGDVLKLPPVCFNFAPLSPWRFRVPGSTEVVSVDVAPKLYVSDPITAVAAAVAGNGVTMVLEHDAAQAVEEGKLEILLPEYETEPFPVHIVHVSRQAMPLKLKCFIDFAAPRLRKSLAAFGKLDRRGRA